MNRIAIVKILDSEIVSNRDFPEKQMEILTGLENIKHFNNISQSILLGIKIFLLDYKVVLIRSGCSIELNNQQISTINNPPNSLKINFYVKNVCVYFLKVFLCFHVKVTISGGKWPVSPKFRRETFPLGRIVSHVNPQLPVLMRSQPSGGNWSALKICIYFVV